MRATRLSHLFVAGALALVGCVVPATTAEAAPAPLVVTTTHVPDAAVGAPYQATLRSSGGLWLKRWSVTDGALPAGLALTGQGRITGTPQAEGGSTFTVTVRDLLGNTASATLDLDVLPMHIATESLPPATLGLKYDTRLQVAGGTRPHRWTLVDGDLPGSITLSPAGRLQGYPGVFDLGPHDITVRVTDSAGRTATRSYLLVSQNLQVTTTSVPDARVGRYYSTRMRSYGGCALPKWFVTDLDGLHRGNGEGILPAGLRISRAWGTISGTPRAAGSYEFRVLAACENGVFSPFGFSDVLTLTVH